MGILLQIVFDHFWNGQIHPVKRHGFVEPERLVAQSDAGQTQRGQHGRGQGRKKAAAAHASLDCCRLTRKTTPPGGVAIRSSAGMASNSDRP